MTDYGVEKYFGEYHQYPVGSIDEQGDTEGAIKRYKPLPTPYEVRQKAFKGLQHYVAGEILDTFDNDYFEDILTSEIVAFEQKHSTSISGTYKHEVFDWRKQIIEGRNHMGLILSHWPAIAVEALNVHFPHALTTDKYYDWKYPPNWVVLNQNQIHINTDFRLVSLQQSGLHYPFFLKHILNKQFVPNRISVDYKYGFDQDKLPATLHQLLLISAAKTALEEAGPMLLTTTSTSVTTFGVTQSASTPGFKLVQSIIDSYDARIKRLENDLLAAYGKTISLNFV